jgi:HAD superfamily hydrolase (TIGR01549 family)
MIRAVLFDLDDTLFDHLYSSECALAALYGRHRCLQQKSLAELNALHKELLEQLHNEVLHGRRSLDSARHERFRQLFARYGEQVAEEEAAAASECYREVFMANRQLVAGAHQLLTYLHTRVRIGIVTNNMLAEQTAKLAHLGIAHLVDALITSEEIGPAKPDPAIFIAALQRLDSTPAETVMVGDSWTADVLGATQLGIRTIWLNRNAVVCPDPALATEINAFEPVEQIAALILHGEPG